ncbi:hypothetical protein HIN51_25190, partial [Salmonella enterica subsp. enterica serovar Dublin]|nr:hypothetical protein [Salmonella enterica subsp. enterica serovar Dublin]
AQVASGEFVAEMKVWGNIASEVGSAIEVSFEEAFGSVGKAINKLNGLWDLSSDNMIKDGTGASLSIAETVADALDFIAKEVRAVERFFEDMVREAEASARVVKAALTPGASVDEAKKQNALIAAALDMQRQLEDATRVTFRQDVDRLRAIAKQKRADYEADKARAKAEGLGKFKIAGDDAGGAAADRSAQAAAKVAEAFDRQKKAAEDFYYRAAH